MRFAIGMFAHETNTFRAGLTEMDDFRKRHYVEGDEVIREHTGVRTDLGGMLKAADDLGIQIAPTLATATEPSGLISRDAYETIRDELFERIKAAHDDAPLDAICLALHGAGVAEGADDLEGTLLGELRQQVGTEIPIVVTLDLHCNMSPAMVEHATALLNCHLYPHTDSYDRGYEAVELAAKIVRGEVKPVMHLETLPLMLPPVTTMEGIGREITEACMEWEAGDGVIDVAFVHGFPHTDYPDIRTTVLATTNNDPEMAKRAAQDVARRIWERRSEFILDLPDATTAVSRALASTNWPVVIAEVSDNPGGGGPGDGTHLLRALLEANPEATCFGFIYDPATAIQAAGRGVGETIRVRLGGRSDNLHGTPIEADAYVKAITDGRFIYSTPMGAGTLADLGPMVRLVIGNVDVLVSSVRTQTLDSEVFLLHGIDVTRYRIVGLKSQQHFRAGFAHLAGEIIRCDTPGSTSSNLATMPFQRLNRPVWPLDDTAWP